MFTLKKTNQTNRSKQYREDDQAGKRHANSAGCGCPQEHSFSPQAPASKPDLAQAFLPTRFGSFKILVFPVDACKDTIVLVKGEVNGAKGVLTRVHSQCFTGDVFCSMRCDCRAQLEKSLQMVEKNGTGIIVYLMQEGRGIGLANKIRAYALQEKGLDTIEANKALGLPVDSRDYAQVAFVLKKLGVKSIRLITNNPEKIYGLKKLGINVQARVPIIMPKNKFNAKYLKTKKEKMGHLL